MSRAHDVKFTNKAAGIRLDEFQKAIDALIEKPATVKQALELLDEAYTQLRLARDFLRSDLKAGRE